MMAITFEFDVSETNVDLKTTDSKIY
jgi:hypothetical protein